MRLKKISVLLILSLILVLGCAVVTQAAEYQKLYRGDVNGDKKYSLRDALGILKMAAQIDTATETADVDLNGTVDKEDVKLMLHLAVYHKGETFGMYTYAAPADEHTLIVDNQAYSHDNRCFHSMKEALAYVNENPPADETERITLDIVPGVYREYLELTAPYVSFHNASGGSGDVKITYFLADGFTYQSHGSIAGADKIRTINIAKGATAFEAENIVFENSYNLYLPDEERDELSGNAEANAKALARFEQNDPTLNQCQAQAMRCQADKAVFLNCKFLGRQDTLMLPNGNQRSYFKDCYIEGTVDFIYGDGTAVFEDCTINCPYGGGYVTAGSTPKETAYGLLFHHCTITREATAEGKAAPADASYALGRPWGQDAMVLFWDCKMDGHIKTGHDRFADMGEKADLHKAEEARFFEAGSQNLNGEPLDLEALVDSTREEVLSESDMTVGGKYAAWKWLWGNDEWNPAGFPTN